MQLDVKGELFRGAYGNPLVTVFGDQLTLAFEHPYAEDV
jgi:hypothetical protein